MPGFVKIKTSYECDDKNYYNLSLSVSYGGYYSARRGCHASYDVFLFWIHLHYFKAKLYIYICLKDNLNIFGFLCNYKLNGYGYG